MRVVALPTMANVPAVSPIWIGLASSSEPCDEKSAMHLRFQLRTGSADQS